ncbi:hypothetical protein LC087_09755 [Bacillus carboniphilus]|uniref:HBM domain-containing protein n=1 Tax=Bacillus carboniphilus TaxID=86663 RepID=A0ABY9JR81_9BACI|nr:hypothetical protein [Bacillus carboniphilus]WLR41228.1 hypothetical protein LC087_09755 [Bacillus carboniphilus]
MKKKRNKTIFILFITGLLTIVVTLTAYGLYNYQRAEQQIDEAIWSSKELSFLLDDLTSYILNDQKLPLDDLESENINTSAKLFQTNEYMGKFMIGNKEELQDILDKEVKEPLDEASKLFQTLKTYENIFEQFNEVSSLYVELPLGKKTIAAINDLNHLLESEEKNLSNLKKNEVTQAIQYKLSTFEKFMTKSLTVIDINHSLDEIEQSLSLNGVDLDIIEEKLAEIDDQIALVEDEKPKEILFDRFNSLQDNYQQQSYNMAIIAKQNETNSSLNVADTPPTTTSNKSVVIKTSENKTEQEKKIDNNQSSQQQSDEHETEEGIPETSTEEQSREGVEEEPSENKDEEKEDDSREDKIDEPENPGSEEPEEPNEPSN